MLSSRRLSPAVPRRASAAPPRPAVTCRRVRAVLAHGAPHGHGAPTATKTGEKQEKEKGFINEMRMVAMKLHTKEQAPKEGGKEAPKQQGPWMPTREGYLRFLAESQVVYDALEQAMSSKSHPEYAQLQSTGLERAAALAKDIAWFKSEYGLSPPALAADGPGHRYAELVTKLAESDPPAFICHFYNFYFAHTAGGRMIGNKVSSMVLGGHVLAFYQWEGDVNTLLDNVRRTINGLAESWTPEQKAHCLAETEASFKYSGEILRCITAA